MVRMMRQPPLAVPMAIMEAQPIFTHSGTATMWPGTTVNLPYMISARQITPMAFWASFCPWVKAMALADSSCSLRNATFTLRWTRFRQMRRMTRMSTMPTMKPSTGEMMMKAAISSSLCRCRAPTPA